MRRQWLLNGDKVNRMILNRKLMLSKGFKILGFDTWSQTTYYTYVRYYDYIHTMVIIDALNQDCYAVRFENAEEMAVFQKGEFTVVFNYSDKSYFGGPTRKKDKIKILEKLNICRIENRRQLDAAILIFENEFILQQV